MSEKMTTANSAEQGKVDIDFAECAVPEVEQTPICDNVYDHAWIYFLFCSMWVGQGNGNRTGHRIYQSPPSGWCDPWYLHTESAWLCRCRDRLKP